MSSKILHLNVTGMTCGKCERLITEGAKEVSGVTDVTIDRPNEKVKICIDLQNPNDLEAKKENIWAL